jgi:uncharacterized phage-associated protein
MPAQAPYDSRAVANLLLDVADQRNLPMTQLSLYKLIYFSHGEYLAHTGAPLIAHDFEAWRHGPGADLRPPNLAGYRVIDSDQPSMF